MAARSSRQGKEINGHSVDGQEKRSRWKVEFPGTAEDRRVVPELIGHDLFLYGVTKATAADGKTVYLKDEAGGPIATVSLKPEQEGEYFKVTQELPHYKELPPTKEDELGVRIKVEKCRKAASADKRAKEQVELQFQLKNGFKAEVSELWSKLKRLRDVECIDQSGFWVQFDRIKGMEAGFHGKVPWTAQPVRVYGKLKPGATLKLVEKDGRTEDVIVAGRDAGRVTLARGDDAYEGTEDENGTIAFTVDNKQTFLQPCKQGVYVLVWAKWKDEKQAFCRLQPKLVTADGSSKLHQQLNLSEDKVPEDHLVSVKVEEILPLVAIKSDNDLEDLLNKKNANAMETFPFGTLEFKATENSMIDQKGKEIDIGTTGAKARIRMRRTFWATEDEPSAVTKAEAPAAVAAPAAENGGAAARTKSDQATASAPARRPSAKKEPSPTASAPPARAPESPKARGRKSQNQSGVSDATAEEEVPEPPSDDVDSPVPTLFTTADALKLLRSQENDQYRSLTAKQVNEIYQNARSDRLTFEQLEEEVNRFLQLQAEAAEQPKASRRGARSPNPAAQPRYQSPTRATSPARQRSPPRSAASPPRSPTSGSRSPQWTYSPQSPRKMTPAEVLEHSRRLHEMHQAKLAKFARMKEESELREARRIQEEANQRRPIRTKLQGQPFDPYDLTDRLHKEHRALKQRHEVLGRRLKEGEQAALESTRTRPRPPEEKSEREINDTVDRLMGWEEHRRKKLEQELARKAEEEKGMIKYGAAEDKSQKLSALQKSQALYDESQARQAALRRREEEVKTQERLQLSQASIHKEEDRAVNMERIEQLHAEAQDRAERRNKQIKAQEDQQTENIKKAKAELKEKHDTVKTKECKNITAKFDEIPKHRRHSFLKQKELEEKEELEKRKPKQLTPMSIIHHVLSTLNTALANRCGNTPEDAPTQELSELGDLLKSGVMHKFKEACSVSDINAEGGANLRNLKNKSLYSDGQLMDDTDGWARCCAPDPIRQLHADLDNLMSVAKKAQAVLQLNFMNDQPKDMEAIEKSWPPDSVYKKPKAFPCVSFGYNPGPKSRESIMNKATVQYGPAEGQRRFMHCLDMARLSLICESSAALRLTLEHICDRFEVVLVRNHYQPHMAGLLGDKYVEVLVVLKQGLPYPMVCEIRLEEQCFFDARNGAKSSLDKVAKGFASIYMRDGISSGNLEYFVKWLLMKPKAVHALTVFRRQLARRYSSSVVAWRQLFSGSKELPQVHMSFQTFREVCGHFNHRSRTVEFWQELDSTSSGRICIFDLDDEAVFLMVKFLGRVVALMPEPEKADGEALFHMMAHKALVKLSRANMMDNSEFRICCKPMGFNQAEADRLFLYLDGHGGCKVQPPATLCPADLEWLRARLPRLVDIPSVILSAADSSTAPFRQLIQWAEATKVDDMNRNDLTVEPIAKKLQRHESICMMREMSESGTHRLSLSAGAMGASLEALWQRRASGKEIEDAARKPAAKKAAGKAAVKQAAGGKSSSAKPLEEGDLAELAAGEAAEEEEEGDEEWVDGQEEAEEEGEGAEEEAAEEAAEEEAEEEAEGEAEGGDEPFDEESF